MKRLILVIIYILITSYAYAALTPGVIPVTKTSQPALQNSDISDNLGSAVTVGVPANIQTVNQTNVLSAPRGTFNPSTFIDASGLVQVNTTSGTPRYNYGYYDNLGFHGTGQVLSLEGASKNILYYTDGTIFYTSTNLWPNWFTQKGAGTLTVSQVLASDLTGFNGSYSQRMQYTGAAGDSNASISDTSYQTDVGTVAQGKTVTFSVWLKSQTGFSNISNVQLVILGDNSSGSYTESSTSSSVLSNITTTWRKFTFTYTYVNSTTSRAAVGIGVNGFNNGSTADIQFWGPQLEIGTSATSFIPTNIAPASRNAETYTTGVLSNNSSSLSNVTNIGTTKVSSFVTTDPYIDVRAYGAKGDGYTDDTIAIQSAINAAISGPKIVFFPTGNYYVSSPLNVTNINIYGNTHNSQGAIIFKGTSGTYGYPNGEGSTIIGSTGGIVFDLSGSQMITMEDMNIISGAKNPSTIGILMARTTIGQFAQFNTFNRVYINIAPNPSANSGNGSIGVYNYASEGNLWTQDRIFADVPMVMTNINMWSISSPYATLLTSYQSMTDNEFDQVSFESTLGPAVIMNGVYTMNFTNAYFFRYSGSALYAVQFVGSSNGQVYFLTQTEPYPRFIDDQSATLNDIVVNNFQVDTDSGPLIYLDTSGGNTPVITNSDIKIVPYNISNEALIGGTASGVGITNSNVIFHASQGISLTNSGSVATGNTFKFTDATPVITLPSSATNTITSPSSTTNTGSLLLPALKSTTGTRYLCISTTGLISSSASACSGT